MEAKKKILFLITEDWYFWSHRRSIAFEALGRGYEVVLVTRVNELKSQIEDTGIKLIPSQMKRSSVNPVHELWTLLELIKIYRMEKPDIVHHVALKPVLYGSWAARIARVPRIVNAFGGLGHLFSSRNSWAKIMKGLFVLVMRLSFLGEKIRIILQNPMDVQQLTDCKIADRSKIVLIRGAGANLDDFFPTPEPAGIPVIMYAGRLLWSKGVGDLIQAVEILKARAVDQKAVLVGRPDPENPESISEETLNEWERKGLIELWGYKYDMPRVLSSSTVVVLPTKYGEGVPKILIEAAAAGRPIVATDIPGCREIVRHDWNGMLVPPDNPEKIADAIESLLQDHEKRQDMGRNGRKLVENEFSEKLILDQTFSVYEELLK